MIDERTRRRIERFAARGFGHEDICAKLRIGKSYDKIRAAVRDIVLASNLAQDGRERPPGVRYRQPRVCPPAATLGAAIAILAATLAALVAIPPAEAQEAWLRKAFTCKAYRADLYWREWAREHCRGYRWRRHRAWHARRWRRRHRETVVRHVVQYEPTCHAVIIAAGDQAQTHKAATDNAVLAWQGRVRFRYGERYLNIQHARGPRGREPEVLCSQSSLPDAYRDKAGSTLYRCELSAKPCRVEAEKLSRRD